MPPSWREEVNGGHDWVSSWLGDMEFSHKVSPKRRIQSSLEAKPKQFNSLGSISGQAMVWDEEEQGQMPQKVHGRPQTTTRLSPRTRLLAPEMVGLPRPWRRNLDRQQVPLGEEHPHIHTSSWAQLSSQPAGWIRLDSVGGSTTLHPHWEAAGPALGDRKVHGREESRGGAGQKITPETNEWLYPTTTQTLCPQLMHLRRQLLDWKDVFPTKASDPKQGEKELLVIKSV